MLLVSVTSRTLRISDASAPVNFRQPLEEPTHMFCRYYGPSNRAFASLDQDASKKLREELEALWTSHNRGGDELTILPGEYLEVVAIRA